MSETVFMRAVRVAAAFALTLFALALPARAAAAPRAQDDAETRQAYELFDNQQFAEAIPLLERLAAKRPTDAQVLARLGIAVFASSVTEGDAEKRKAQRAKGRAHLVRAKELGVTNNLIEGMISGTTADGSLVGGGGSGREGFSQNREADQAMRAGEAALTRAEYEEALKAYARASELDPKIYEAPLFAGDVYLKRQEWEKAAASYNRAVQLDPDRETAYRYWGNSLMRQSRFDEARDKYLEAIIADPYNAYVWQNGIFRWAQARGVRLSHPKIEVQSSVSRSKGNEMGITIDPKSLEKKGDGSTAWMLYSFIRVAWAADNYEKFRKEFPAEKTYRHSLREEAEALRTVIEGVRIQQKSGEIKSLSPDLRQLMALEEAGLLEAYILFARPNEGIAQDYAAYRKANRDKLRRYLLEHLASGKH